jgi:hypothetical protein
VATNDSQRAVAFSRQLRQAHQRPSAGHAAEDDPSGKPSGLLRELDGLAAIAESHFRYEERAISAALDNAAACEGTGAVGVAGDRVGAAEAARV